MIKKYKLFLEGKKDKFPNVKKILLDDFVILLGKDAKSNDYLTFMMAENDDIWMHVKGFPGSHLVIKIKNNLPTETLLKACAQMAKKNSKADKEDQVSVVYCKRKFVKKEPGMNDGQVKVDYLNAAEIVV